MNKTYVILALVGVIVLGFLTSRYFFKQAPDAAPASTVTNFEECAKAGGQIMESSPARCRTADDKIFTENVSNPTRMEKISNFEECAQAGYPVTMSYPRQCRSSEGKTFTEFVQ